MKHFNRFLAAFIAVLTLAVQCPAAAQPMPKLLSPVLVTALGQSLDAFQVQLSLKRAQIEFDYDPIAPVEKMLGKKALFLAIGASVKGFGSAGVSFDDELKRGNALVAAAQGARIPIIVLHVGGAERRDKLTDQFVDVFAPKADALILKNDSDLDGKFKSIAAAKKIPILTFDNVLNLRRPFQEMFGKTP